MDDILPLELLQGIICIIERIKEGTLILGEGHKLEDDLILEEPQTPLALGTQPRY